ncbi:hypothetical protein PMIN06_002585 [Paraphaeosphaeria minitans]
MSAAGAPYPRLPAAVLQQTVEVTPVVSPDDLVKTYLLDVTSELLALQAAATSLGPSSTDRYSPSLRILHARLQEGHHSPFPGLEHRGGEAFVCTGEPHPAAVSPAMDRPLGDFEDMYYAILATVKETHESIILRLNNGFVHPTAPLFPSCQYTVYFFQEWLAHQWTILNEPSLVRALDMAVRKALVDGHLCQGLRSQVVSGQMTRDEAEMACAHLYQSEVFADMPGLGWVGNEHAAMINGRLNEKYRVVFRAEKQAHDKRKTRLTKKRERNHKTAKTGSKARGRRASGEHGPQQRQATAGQAQQAADVFSVAAKGHMPHSEVEHAEQANNKVHHSPQADQPGINTQPLLREEVEAWRLYTQQQMSSQRELQRQHHDDEPRRKTPPTAALQAFPDGFRAGAVSYTPQGQTHAAHGQQDISDAGAAGQEHVFPATSPRDVRAQRVTEYQAWLRGSASDHARRRMMGHRDQVQVQVQAQAHVQAQAQASDVGDLSLQASHGAEGPLDVDVVDVDVDVDVDGGS